VKQSLHHGRCHWNGQFVRLLHHTLIPRLVTMLFAGRCRGNKVKKGVQFTVMVISQSSFISHFPCGSFPSYTLLGTSGTRCTTFVNTLCESEVLLHKVCNSPETVHVEEGIRVKPVNVGVLHFFRHQVWFSWGLSCCLFRAGGGWHAHCPDTCGHSWIW
jgi:hypothetical protein